MSKYQIRRYTYATGESSLYEECDSEVVAYMKAERLNELYPVGSTSANGQCFIMIKKEGN